MTLLQWLPTLVAAVLGVPATIALIAKLRAQPKPVPIRVRADRRDR